MRGSFALCLALCCVVPSAGVRRSIILEHDAISASTACCMVTAKKGEYADFFRGGISKAYCYSSQRAWCPLGRNRKDGLIFEKLKTTTNCKAKNARSCEAYEKSLPARMERTKRRHQEQACRCSGHTRQSDGRGSPNCQTTFQGQPFCYTNPGACSDGKASETEHGHHYSFAACKVSPHQSSTRSHRDEKSFDICCLRRSFKQGPGKTKCKAVMQYGGQRGVDPCGMCNGQGPAGPIPTSSYFYSRLTGCDGSKLKDRHGNDAEYCCSDAGQAAEKRPQPPKTVKEVLPDLEELSQGDQEDGFVEDPHIDPPMEEDQDESAGEIDEDETSYRLVETEDGKELIESDDPTILGFAAELGDHVNVKDGKVEVEGDGGLSGGAIGDIAQGYCRTKTQESRCGQVGYLKELARVTRRPMFELCKESCCLEVCKWYADSDDGKQMKSCVKNCLRKPD